MHLRTRTPLVTVLLVGAVAILSPASSLAIPIHQHLRDPATGEVLERVVHVAPPDSDDDGVANADDECPKRAAATEDGCPAPVVALATTTASTDGSYLPSEPITETGAASGDLAAIAQCESGGDPTAVSPDGTYRGLYQFDQSTWESVGGSGDPAAASAAEQTARAQALMAERGSAPWPVCGG